MAHHRIMKCNIPLFRFCREFTSASYACVCAVWMHYYGPLTSRYCWIFFSTLNSNLLIWGHFGWRCCSIGAEAFKYAIFFDTQTRTNLSSSFLSSMCHRSKRIFLMKSHNDAQTFHRTFPTYSIFFVSFLSLSSAFSLGRGEDEFQHTLDISGRNIR